MLNVRKISLLAFWSLELYTLRKSECQAPGASRAPSSGLRNGLVPGTWRIYGHLNPIQVSRREAWERASQVHDKIRATAGERGVLRGWVISTERIPRALEFWLGAGGEMKFRLWSSGKGQTLLKEIPIRGYSLFHRKGEKVAKSWTKKKRFWMFSFLCVWLSVYGTFILRLFSNVSFPSPLFLDCPCSLAYRRELLFVFKLFCYNRISVIACADISAQRHA